MNASKRSSLVALGVLGCHAAWGQSEPKGTVKISSVFPTGSGPDVVARIIATKLQAKWNQSVVVDAKPGGAGAVAIASMMGQAPTGNDLVVVDVGNLSINPLIFKKLAYDPDKDLVPVAVLYKTAFFVAVSTESPIKSIKDLMVAAANKSMPLKYGSNAVGGPIHLGSARLETALGAEMLHIPYKEISQLYASVSTGEIDWALASIASAGPLLKAGKLRFLAVVDQARSAAMPEVLTLAEAGGPRDLYATTWVALMASRGTPETITSSINKAVDEALAMADVKERLAGFGFVPSPGSPQQVLELTRADRARYAEVLKRVKVSVD